MPEFELLIFDWDGTLADSAGHIVSTTQKAILDLGLPPRENHQIAELIGLGLLDGMRRLYPEFDPNWVMAQLFAHRRESGLKIHSTPLFDGAAEALAALRDQGFRLAVATGKPRAGLDGAFDEHDLRSLFEISRCADETADKPHPLMLEEILRETGVAADRALMIGDTEYDVAMAAAVGVPALGVACGVHAPGRLLAAGAMAVIKDARALPAWLR
ncbi:MAG: HAD-IA family hydrolase [Nevskia sp.]|nr:HAD-IA family hydrolase [Nevskia sp.]